MPPLSGTPLNEADTLSADVAILLAAVAAGKYDKQIAWAMTFLRTIGLGRVAIIIEAFLLLNKITAPIAPLIHDGHGGVVPGSNSRYNPKTGMFIETGRSETWWPL